MIADGRINLILFQMTACTDLQMQGDAQNKKCPAWSDN